MTSPSRSPPTTSCLMMHWRRVSMFLKTARMTPRFSAPTTLFLWLESWLHLKKSHLLCLQILLRMF